MDDLEEEFLNQIRANLRASKITEWKKSSGKFSVGGPCGESGYLPCDMEPTKNETERVAGEKMAGGIIGGRPPETEELSESGNSSSSKQLRVRLPHGFAKALQELRKPQAVDVFLITVFGAIGNVYAPGDFFAAYKELQRVGSLLRQSRENCPGELLSRVNGSIKMIDQVCRARRVGYVAMRMRLPRDYADALLTLSASKRELIIRLAVGASKASLSMSSLVSKAHVLRDVGERLKVEMASGVLGPPELEIRELLDLISGLHLKSLEGGRGC